MIGSFPPAAKQVLKLLVILSVLMLAPAQQLFGQSSQGSNSKRIGRLPDGRAYRVDQQGFQLIDQLAELEVTSDDLRRQVIALENELAQKQRTIDSLRSSGHTASSSGVKEATLIPPAAVAVKKSAASNEPPDCNELVSGLYMQISRLETQLREKPSAPEIAALPANTSTRCPEVAEDPALREQVSRLQTALMDAPSKESFQAEQQRNGRLASEVTELRSSLEKTADNSSAARSQLQDRLQDKNQQVANLQEELARRVSEKDTQLRQLEIQLAEQSSAQAVTLAKVQAESEQQLRAIEQDLADSRASERGKLSSSSPAQSSQKLASQQPVKVATRMTQVGESSQLETERGRREFSQSLAAIQSKIMKRKDQLDSLKKSSKGISITVSTLTTTRGQSLDMLRGEVKRLNSSSDLASIRRGLQEIDSQLDDDLATLRRLMK